MISYFSNRGGLGGVSIHNVKGDDTISQLLIKDANKIDEVGPTLCYVTNIKAGNFMYRLSRVFEQEKREGFRIYFSQCTFGYSHGRFQGLVYKCDTDNSLPQE